MYSNGCVGCGGSGSRRVLFGPEFRCGPAAQTCLVVDQRRVISHDIVRGLVCVSSLESWCVASPRQHSSRA